MSHSTVDPWLLKHLVCPAHRRPLRYDGQDLHCDNGDSFPVVHGVPVMVRRDVPQTLWVANESLETVDGYRRGELALPTQPLGKGEIDGAVQELVAHTNGFLYLPLVQRLKRYPIPELRLPEAVGDQTLLDLGCGWGRWCVAAARKGYRAVGIDPSLRHVLAARRVCEQLGVASRFLVADARERHL